MFLGCCCYYCCALLSKLRSCPLLLPIDRYFNYKFGPLEYRSLIFKHERLDIPDYQGTFMMSYPEPKYGFTRIIEHKHFEFGEQDYTYITKEYPDVWGKNKIPYYPINNDKNNEMFKKYKELTTSKNLIFGGRLAEYKYYDMHQIIGSAINKTKSID